MPSSSQKEWLGALAGQYHESLSPETASYLAARGIDQDLAHGALLGEVVNPDPAHEQYRGRLSIPFITPTGVVYMRFRCLSEHDCGEFSHGKYEGAAGLGTHLYNVAALHADSSVVAICEGELDALVANDCGIPAVGVPGANNWKPFYYRLFDDYEKVIIIGDGDTAGRRFANELASKIPDAIPRPMPKDHDVTSFVVENGAGSFLEYLGV